MHTLFRRMVVAAAVAVPVAAAAPAVAAPDRTVAFDVVDVGTFSWTSAPNVGLAPTAQIADAVECDVRMCDDTLVKIDELGKLEGRLLGNEPTLLDVDLYLFKSNAAGEALAEVTRVTDFDADETFALGRIRPGFYLVRGDWSLGAGSFNGTLKYTPTPLSTTAKRASASARRAARAERR